MDLKVLLASADDSMPYLKGGVSIEKAAQGLRPGGVEHAKPGKPTHLDDPHASPNHLPKQRWSVIVPEEGGDELFARISELVEHRQNEQCGKIQGAQLGKPFKVPANLGSEQASRWIDENLGRLDDPLRPRYLLLLGDLREVSLELQQALSVYYFVGRLTFDNPDGYNKYARKVTAAAREERRRNDARAVSYTVRTEFGNDATDNGYTALMLPTVDLAAQKLRGKSAYPVSLQDVSPPPGDATWQSFLEMAADPRPTILMSMSHGLGQSRRRRWSEEQRRYMQGQMAFGYGKESLPPEAIANCVFIPNGLWLYFACFGAGTPDTSAYQHWLTQVAPGMDVLSALPQRGSPFIAALPQAALANPTGPLAVIGHIDLAWNYSYEKNMTQRVVGLDRRLARLLNLAVRDNEDPRRIGTAMRSLMGDLPQVQQDLTNMYDAEARAAIERLPSRINPLQRAHLWMLRQDLRAYILLGDPAAHLPVDKAPPEPQPSVRDMLGFDPVPSALTTTMTQSEAERIAHLIYLVLTDEKTTKVAKREAGVEDNPEQWQKWLDVYHKLGREGLARSLLKG